MLQPCFASVKAAFPTMERIDSLHELRYPCFARQCTTGMNLLPAPFLASGSTTDEIGAWNEWKWNMAAGRVFRANSPRVQQTQRDTLPGAMFSSGANRTQGGRDARKMQWTPGS